MYKGFKKIKILKIVTFLLMLSFLFCCQAAWGYILPIEHGDMAMAHGGQCDMGGVGQASEGGHTPALMASSVNFLNTINLVNIFLFALFLHLSLKVIIFLQYVKKVRDRYGGFKLFENYSHLFKIGILHPKTF